MEKWKYKYSFFCGIFFLLSFVGKEMVLFSPKAPNTSMLVVSYLFLIIYVVGLFLGFLKYSILNQELLLKLATILLLVAYPLIILAELLERTFELSLISPLYIIIPKLLLSIVLIVFAIALFKQKKIYGKRTIFQGILSILFSVSGLFPILVYFQLPLFFIFFISLTYLIKKKIKKKDEFKGRLL